MSGRMRARVSPAAARFRKGPLDWAEVRWMTSAILLTPEPGAPVTSTSAEVRAACRTWSRNCWLASRGAEDQPRGRIAGLELGP